LARVDNSLAQNRKTRAADAHIYGPAQFPPGVDSGAGRRSAVRDMRRKAVTSTGLSNPQARHVARMPGDGVARLRPGALRMLDSSYVVAVIDDDDVVREALAGLLAAHEYEVELYESAEEFLGAVADSKANCLLVDVHLGGICGIELGRGLIKAGFRFPIIFMTGSTDESLRGRAMQAGCVAFLTKPFSPPALTEALSAAARRGSH
jgi:CheY-like chemotaxis protein